MSSFIALDWDKHELAGVCGQVTQSKVTVTDTFALPCPDEIDLAAQPAQAGAWLKTEFDRRGIAAKKVLLTLPRDEVVLRRLDVPDTADQTLSGIVRYQAGTQTSVPLDQLVLDYLPLPVDATAEGRAVLMATAGKPLVNNLATMFREANLDLAGVGIGSLATLELVARFERQRNDSANQTSLVVARTVRGIEISLMRGLHAVFTHAAPLIGDDETLHRQAIRGEVSRALLAFAPTDSDFQVDRAWLLGVADPDGEFGRDLQQRLECDVHRIDAFDEIGVEFSDPGPPANPARFAAGIGMLLSRDEPLLKETIDFLRPRQPVVHRHRQKLLLGLLAASALFAILAAYAGQRIYLKTLDSEIADKRSEQQQLGLAVRQGQPMLKSAASVGQWQQREVNWLEQLEAIGASMPDPARIYLAACRLQSVSGETVARVQADGYARERGDVESLHQQLADHEAFRVRPNEIQSGPSYEDYPIRFEIDADIVPSNIPATEAK